MERYNCKMLRKKLHGIVIFPRECYNEGIAADAVEAAGRKRILQGRMEIVRRMRWLCMLLALALLAGTGTALADDTVRIDHDALALDGEWVDGTIREQEYHYFPIQTEAVGKLTVRVQTTLNSLPFQFLDADLQTWDSLYIYGTVGAPGTGDFVYYLEPGTYYVRYCGDRAQVGDFRLKASFEAVACDETEKNDDYHGAMPLPASVRVSGVLTQGDDGDYYAIASDAEKLHLLCNSEAEGQQIFTLYDSDMVECFTEYDLRGLSREDRLGAGTYYLRVFGATGPYTLRWESAD